MGRIVEVDIDGVIADIHGAGISPFLQNIYPGFHGDIHIESYSMAELDLLDKRLRPAIFELFADPNFIGNLTFYSGVLEALIRLDRHFNLTGDKLVFNSHVLNESCVNARYLWLDKMLKPAGINYEAIVSCGKNKKVLNSYITVEDNVQNLLNSKASVKILIRRGHNRHAPISVFGSFKNIFYVDSFVEASNIIKEFTS